MNAYLLIMLAVNIVVIAISIRQLKASAKRMRETKALAQQWEVDLEDREGSGLTLQQRVDEKIQEDIAHAEFQHDISYFPRRGVSVWGVDYQGWREALQGLVGRGLSLDEPNEDFSRLKRAVEHGVAYNLEAISNSSNPAYTAMQQSNFAVSKGYLREAQTCLNHLNEIEAGWTRQAMDQATAPAAGECQPIGRI